jgi:hypothetical protein
MSAVPLAALAAATEAGRGWIGSWSPGIGDPNVVGWLTVVGYLVASAMCWRQYRRLGGSGEDRARARVPLFAAFALAFVGARRRLLAMPVADRLRALWLGLAVVLLLLGINKQLDLQTALTEGARIWARHAGWYEVRRPVQVAFIGAVALVGLLTLRAVLLLARGELGSLRAVLAGTVFIAAFVTIRAASFHHIDRLLGTDIGGFRMNWIVEVGGILFIIFGARPGAARRPPAAAAGGA